MIIDVEKFISSLIERSSGITQQIFHSDLLNALKEQGLEYKDGEIVKTQRWIAAEAKEAIFDNEDEKIRRDIIRILKGELGYTSKEDADKYIAWLEKQELSQSVTKKSEQVHSILDLKLMDCPLSVKTISVVKVITDKAARDVTLGDLVKCTKEELLGLRNFGKTSLKEIEDFLAEYGLKLKGE